MDNDYAYDADNMEPPTKRPRLSTTSDSPEEEDVPNDWNLQAARAQNDTKLKSIFENIFAKYSQDFTQVGDEIDLETGDIVIDNGHLLGLQKEGSGNQTQAWHEGESENEESAEPQHEPDDLVFEDPGKHPEDSFIFSRLKSTGLMVNAEDSALTSTSDNPKARPVSKQEDLKPPPEELGPTDPVWKVPELPRSFSTPRTESRFTKVATTPRPPTLNRQSSPPGSRSLWSLPQRRRPRTEGKPRATPNKTRPRAKRKYHSSPVAPEALDWSFAQVPDGNESDDPLAEHQPSPTPSKRPNIRGKRMRMTTLANSRVENRFEPNRELSTSAEAVLQDQSATATHLDAKHGHVEQGDAQGMVADAIDSQCDSSAHPPATHGAAPALGSRPVSVPSPSPMSPPNSPRNHFTLDEVRLLVRMRYVECKSWSDIQWFLPYRKKGSMRQWHYNHWTVPRAEPPSLRVPWLTSELETLDRLKNRPGFSWGDLRAEFPGRLKSEIEFELLRLWVGEEIWNSEWNGLPLDDNGRSSERQCDSPLPKLGQDDSPRGQYDSPQSQYHSSEVEDHDQELSATSLQFSASQTPTVYLISDDEDMDDLDRLSDNEELDQNRGQGQDQDQEPEEEKEKEKEAAKEPITETSPYHLFDIQITPRVRSPFKSKWSSHEPGGSSKAIKPEP